MRTFVPINAATCTGCGAWLAEEEKHPDLCDGCVDEQGAPEGHTHECGNCGDEYRCGCETPSDDKGDCGGCKVEDEDSDA